MGFNFLNPFALDSEIGAGYKSTEEKSGEVMHAGQGK